MRKITLILLITLLGAANARAQSTLATTANAMAPGTWTTLTTTGFNNGAAFRPGTGSILEYMDKGIWNPINKSVMILGASHTFPGDCTGNTLFKKYADSTNAWTDLTLPCQSFDNNSAHGYDHNAIDTSNGDFYHRQYSSGKIMKFAHATQSWSQCSIYNQTFQVYQVAGALTYFPERRSLVFLDGDWGVWELDISGGNCTGSWSLIASTNGGGNPPTLTGLSSYQNVAEHSPLCHCIIMGGSGTTLYKYSAKGAFTQIASAPAQIGIPESVGGSIFTVDPASGKFLAWTGSGTGQVYDPIANTWAATGISSPIFPAIDGRVTETVAIPISDYNVIMFVQNSSGGLGGSVQLYKHSLPTSDMDAAKRCAAPGVFMCTPLDSSSELAGAYGDINGTIAGDGGNLPVIDTTTFASGGGSLKCQILTTGGSAKCGDAWFSFANNITLPGTTRLYFDSGQDFYIQWRQRFSPTYGQSGQFKQANIGGGDPQGCTSGTSASCTDGFGSGTGAISSCNAAELVVQNTGSSGQPISRQFAQMYNSCTGSASHGAFNPFEQSVSTAWNSSNFYFQNATGPPGCYYQQQAGGPLGGYDANRFPPTGSCIGYFPNEWMTFQVHVHLGTFTNGEYANSHIDLWIAREGQVAGQAYNFGPYNLTSSGGGFTHLRYGKIWLTGYDTTGALNLATTWFDELIVSTARIPDPGQASAPSSTPIVSLSPSSLSFGNQPLQVTSSPQNVTLTNTGSATLSITSITLTGANPTNFSISSNSCGSVGPGLNCIVGITFTPLTVGSKAANLTFVTNAASSPDNVPLTGTGQAPVASFNPASVTFNGIKVGLSSSQVTVTLTNVGTATMSISSITLTGANTTDFGLITTCGATLAPSASCPINVTFTPLLQGLRSANVSITSNTATSPDLIPLAGVGFNPISGTGTISGAGSIRVQP